MNIAHIFAHAATNLGDIYLKEATQQAFSSVFPGARFTAVEARKIYAQRDLDDLNAHDLVVIGGGGLLLRDTFPNDVSDWQWGCSVDLMEGIHAPIAVYAIGYNRFRGQEDFARPLFDRHMGTLLRKSVFFSARNTGSVDAIRRYVPEALGEKIVLNHCPSMLFPRVVLDRPVGTAKIGLLLAGDRLHLRHGRQATFARKVGALMKELSRHAEIHVVAHQPHDLWYMDHMKDVPHTFVDLIGKSTAEAAALYSYLDVMIGDRGHAQMIPFALGCRIVSLVSHDKLQWFLDDMGLPEFGVEEGDPDLVEKVLALVHPAAGDDYGDRRAAALHAMSLNSYRNLALIRGLLPARAA